MTASDDAGSKGWGWRIATQLMRLARRDPLYTLDPELAPAAVAEILARRGIDAMRSLLLVARGAQVSLPSFVGRGVSVVGAGQLTVGRGCQIGDWVLIDAVSRRGVRLGENVTLDRYVMLKCTGALRELGQGIAIGDNSSIGAFSYVGGSGGVRIGRNVLGGQRLSFHPENHAFGRIDIPIREQGSTRSGILVEDDCWLGTGSIFLDGVTVGRGSVVAAGSTVTKDVPPYSVAAGVPAKVVQSRLDGGSHSPSGDQARPPARMR